MSIYPTLTNKTYVVMGIANKRSIAWAIAKTLDEAGAKLVLTYAAERFKSGLESLASELKGDALLLECDVTNDEAIDTTFRTIHEQAGEIQGIAHSIAFADKEALRGEFSEMTRGQFAQALDISAYSLTAVVKAAKPYFAADASVITLTYLGGERVVPNYNLMGVAKAALDSSVTYLANEYGPQGVRVNAISAGPIRTLSAKGVGDFNSILSELEQKAPLRRNVSAEEVASTALFLLSSMGSGVTGEVIHVDSGYHIL
ncbi:MULTISPECIES: enoyl-ACP reductase FabI [Exiguobacterium]|uniref:enoyl-ACP reductase FabI n=1 Tax=Exiguobacterium TaxID=33986 RepID=UPI001BE54363|nr:MULTISPECIES: enoyl-ACP reductase FabI [Exiguobacterium]MCT4781893.1 enoyl-ACP reductase FabI [Exiguobacterium himgiriensis]